MGLTNVFKQIEQRLPWGIIGGLLGLLGIVIGIYYGVRHPVSRLVLDIINEVNVLDVRQPVRDLAIAFRGQDVQQANLNLRVFTARLANVGDVDILQSHYDKDDTWGIRVADGKLIEARLVESNSSYVQAQLNPAIVGDNLVALTKVILERGKHFTLELLVLHPKDATPRLSVIGKIAGIDEIPVNRTWADREQVSIWSQAWSGRPIVHFVRIGIYLGGGLLALLLIAAFAAFIDDRRRSLRHKRGKKEFSGLIGDLRLDSQTMEILAGLYAESGLEGLRALRRSFDDTELLLRATTFHERIAIDHGLSERLHESEAELRRGREARLSVRAASSLVRAGMVKREGDKEVSIAAGLPKTVDDVIAAIKARGQKPIAD
jgi:hypothetical protein